jgi:hypothetical protein
LAGVHAAARNSSQLDQAGMIYAPIIVPPGACFKDMVALKGKPESEL